MIPQSRLKTNGKSVETKSVFIPMGHICCSSQVKITKSSLTGNRLIYTREWESMGESECARGKGEKEGGERKQGKKLMIKMKRIFNFY